VAGGPGRDSPVTVDRLIRKEVVMIARIWIVAGLIVGGTALDAAAAQRTTLAIRYQEGRTTEIRLDGTSASPRVRGKAKVEAKRGTAAIEVELDEVGPASSFGPYYATYVLWGITPEGRTNNLGELPWKGDKKLRATLPIQRFGLLVTAEPYGAVTQPSPRVIAENRLKEGESVASTGEITYEGDDGGLYSEGSTAEAAFDSKTPTPVVAARLSVKVAERADAGTYARGELTQATEKLAQMEVAFKTKPNNEGAWGSFARETARLAQAARTNAGSRRAQVALVEERQQQMKTLEKAKADADAAAQAARLERERAETERKAAERAMAEQRSAAAEAERAKQAATSAQQQALAAKEEAVTAQQQAEQARAAQQAAYDQATAAMREAQQATAERDKVRQQLEQSLSAILETTRSARGLVVNLGDVLFDTGKATLRPEAREKLSRLTGVLLAYPAAYTVEVEGHTDSTGSDELNNRLSQARAESVRDYVISGGIRSDRFIGTRGFGKTRPVAGNDTSEGRQRNRRVEIVINDQAKTD
jgi:outer membrane protein OmpA-like peptidoglycan-associated protein